MGGRSFACLGYEASVLLQPRSCSRHNFLHVQDENSRDIRAKRFAQHFDPPVLWPNIFKQQKSLFSSTSGAHGEGVLSLTLWLQADYTVRRSAVLTAARDKWFRGSANFVQTRFRRGRVRVSDLSKPLLVLPAVRKHPFLTRESAI